MGCGGSTAAVTSKVVDGPVDDEVAQRLTQDCGVSLQVLLDLANEVEPGETCASVVGRIIKPRTVSSMCRFVDTLPPSSVNTPDFFVSHMWAGSFREMVQLVQEYVLARETDDNEPGEVFLWLDILAINQHTGNQASNVAHKLARTFSNAKATLFCLDEHGIALTRIWCLYELWSTVQLGSANRLKLLTTKLDYPVLRELYQHLDASTARATFEGDRMRLLNDMTHSPTGPTMNKAIKQAILDSVVAEVKRAEELADRPAVAVYRLQHQARILSEIIGEHEKAVGIMRGVLELLERIHADGMEMWEAMGQLGLMLQRQGKSEEAEDILRQAASMSEEANGKGDPSTGPALTKLASVLSDLGRYDEAEPLLQSVLAMNQRTLGAAHPDTISATSELSSLLALAGKYDEAEPLRIRVLQITEGSLGASHIRTAIELQRLAHLLHSTGKTIEAVETMQRAVAAAEKAVGDKHPMTHQMQHDLKEVGGE